MPSTGAPDGRARRRLAAVTRALAVPLEAPQSPVTASAVASQAVAVALPWLLAGGLGGLWAAWPAFTRALRALNPSGPLAGTQMTKEMLEAFASGLKNVAFSHPPSSFSPVQRSPHSVADVLSPKHVPVFAIPAMARPRAMARRLALGKLLNARLSADSAGDQLAYDLIEKIGMDSMATSGLVNQLGHEAPVHMATDHDNWISDGARTIHADHFTAINETINSLYAKWGIEAAVVTLEGQSGSGDTREFAVRLFNRWGIGGAKSNHGILVVHTMAQRKIDIIVGDGMAPVLPDHLCERILQNYIVPHFRRERFGEGLAAGVEAISNAINEQAGFEDRAAAMSNWHPPIAPKDDFGGGRKGPGSTITGLLGGASLAIGATAATQYIKNNRCSACGKFSVKDIQRTHPPADVWVDQFELELVEHMDSDGRVSRTVAAQIFASSQQNSMLQSAGAWGPQGKAEDPRLRKFDVKLDQLYVSSKGLTEIFELAMDEPAEVNRAKAFGSRLCTRCRPCS